MPLSQLFRVGFQSLKEGVAVELAFKKSLWAQKIFRSWLWWGILCWEQENTKKRHMLKGYQRNSVVWLWRARLSGQGAQAAIPPRNAPSIWVFQPHDCPVSTEGSIGPLPSGKASLLSGGEEIHRQTLLPEGQNWATAGGGCPFAIRKFLEAVPNHHTGEGGGRVGSWHSQLFRPSPHQSLLLPFGGQEAETKELQLCSVQMHRRAFGEIPLEPECFKRVNTPESPAFWSDLDKKVVFFLKKNM